jgi:hypothetical protein
MEQLDYYAKINIIAYTKMDRTDRAYKTLKYYLFNEHLNYIFQDSNKDQVEKSMNPENSPDPLKDYLARFLSKS